MTDVIQSAINKSLQSDNPQKVLEATVADAVIGANIAVIAFNKTIGKNGCVGEIDIETDRAIIEVTTQTSRKLKQIQKLLSNSDLNPHHKSVILYAPNYKETPAQDILNADAYLVRNLVELLERLNNLGDFNNA